jgi:hypothetical protein
MILERWTNPELSRRTCTCEYGLPSCRGKLAGVAKRPRERTQNPQRYDSQLLHRCMAAAPSPALMLMRVCTRQGGWHVWTVTAGWSCGPHSCQTAWSRAPWSWHMGMKWRWGATTASCTCWPWSTGAWFGVITRCAHCCTPLCTMRLRTSTCTHAHTRTARQLTGLQSGVAAVEHLRHRKCRP